MDLVGWLATVVGITLVILVMTDLLLTVLHADTNGLALRVARMIVWPAARQLALTVGQHGRTALSLAGPLILIGGFLIWLVVFVLGFALIYWPHLDDSYRSADGVTDLSFMAAIYYSVVTGTVLGYGDISPLTAPLQLLAGRNPPSALPSSPGGDIPAERDERAHRAKFGHPPGLRGDGFQRQWS